MTDITAGQYQITRSTGANAFSYGRGQSSIQIASTQADMGSVTVQDQPVIGADGTQFGIDTLPGMVITQTGYAMTTPFTPGPAMDAYSALAAAWNDPVVRMAPGAYQVLRAFYPGAASIRRAYGRGRKIMPTYGQANQGLVPFAAQFQCADNNWYSDAQFSATISAGPVIRTGMTFPATPPVSPAQAPYSVTGVIANAGPLPTWPVFQFSGPVTNPMITYVGTPVGIGYSGTLGAADTLVIDTRPWARSCLLNGVAAAGGMAGSAMIAMQAQPGTTAVILSGSFTSGFSSTQAQCVIQWRSAYPAIGGSA
jgi:hypothetical protein